jgi:hypothetical protein
MKRAAVPVAMLAAGVVAQDLTTTITYSVCPTATTTTITLPTTITYCPGGFCNVTPTGGVPGGTVTQTTTTTSYITVFPYPCPKGPGMCDASYTIWEPCPCTEHTPGYIPSGFTTTLHECDVCGHDGGPTTYTRTMPCTDGAEATQTPSYGGKWVPGPHPEIPVSPAEGQQWNDNGAAPADGQSWSDNGVSPAEASQGWADAPKGAAPVAPASGAPAAPVADASKSWGDNNVAPASATPAAGQTWADNSAAPVAASSSAGWADNKPADYTGAGSKVAFGLSTMFAGVVGALALML